MCCCECKCSKAEHQPERVLTAARVEVYEGMVKALLKGGRIDPTGSIGVRVKRAD